MTPWSYQATSRVAIAIDQNPGETEQMAKTAFIGLGVMGYPMAGHLRAKGHEVTVYNRTTAKAEA